MCLKINMQYFQIGVLICSMTIRLTNADVFSAIVEMEGVFKIEALLINNLEHYIEGEETKIDNLKKKLKKYQKIHTQATDDTSYLTNPINAYLLTKRLISDWHQIETVIDVKSTFLENITNYRRGSKFPTRKDLQGAAVALSRLQSTYNLETENVARGELNGVQSGTEMTSSDCFELGRELFFNENYKYAVSWLNESLGRFTKEAEEETSYISRAEILDPLVYSLYKQGDIRLALNMTNEILQLIPDHENALKNKISFEYEMSLFQEEEYEMSLLEEDVDNVLYEDIADEFTATEEYDSFKDAWQEEIIYGKLCRGETMLTPEQLRPLRCLYTDNNIPFLKIAPFKIEEINIDPYIVVFHDVIYDHEIDIVKKMAHKRLNRSVTSDKEPVEYRVSKTAWLKDDDHEYITNIVRRLQDMTRLSMETAEYLQVLNYGIGGHYIPHYDWLYSDDNKNNSENLGNGGRIATLLFYLSDVEQGGATVFPSLRIATWPKKGTAVFWYNLHSFGQVDYRVLHAACPVLSGSKWVANKWIHERGQEFRRVCELDEYNKLMTINKKYKISVNSERN